MSKGSAGYSSSSHKSSLKGSSKVYMWYCDNCSNGPYLVANNDYCPNCHHQRCSYCVVERAPSTRR
ncbi:hypothetical protein QBC35DRAFT_450703 [Podospora australis]|uniref:RanBP2-type domain-containing protein n=1 Tax=Podospora australis TaxID=1536484 RepID=A0AAN6WVD9_9PEZI|nr:hypothetical protein QBC35DRAFT_450703 [Podospora australis]